MSNMRKKAVLPNRSLHPTNRGKHLETPSYRGPKRQCDGLLGPSREGVLGSYKKFETAAGFSKSLTAGR